MYCCLCIIQSKMCAWKWTVNTNVSLCSVLSTRFEIHCKWLQIRGLKHTVSIIIAFTRIIIWLCNWKCIHAVCKGLNEANKIVDVFFYALMYIYIVNLIQQRVFMAVRKKEKKDPGSSRCQLPLWNVQLIVHVQL